MKQNHLIYAYELLILRLTFRPSIPPKGFIGGDPGMYFAKSIRNQILLE